MVYRVSVSQEHEWLVRHLIILWQTQAPILSHDIMSHHKIDGSNHSMNHTYHTCIRIRECFNHSSTVNTLEV